jgi:hypothetical protein
MSDDWHWTSTELAQITTEASAAGTAQALHSLAEHLRENPDTVLIGLWSTGFGEPHEFVFQVVLETGE